MNGCRLWRYRIAATLLLGWTALGGAQENTTAPVAQTSARNESASSATLERLVSVALDRVPLEQALTTIAAAAHLSLTYSTTQLPHDKMVSLTATAISAREAFDVCLGGTGLEVVSGANGRVRIRPSHAESTVATAQQQGTASISGYVRDSATEAPLTQVSVRVDGTTLEAKTNATGQYQITGVAAGSYRVTVRRVGYLAKSRPTTVVDGQVVTLNFDLNSPPTTLNEVVTTATGELHRYEVGNVISSINVDSIAPTAPVTSITDLLTSRVPGLEVVETGGLVGSGESIQIRGLSSMLLNNNPIIIVDGLRVDNTPGGTTTNLVTSVAEQGLQYGVPSPSRINDIDFTQVATLTVLKGPSATTLYGTDAANGVIVITTKRGTSGKAQWNVSAEQDVNGIPGPFPEEYNGWGHTTDGSAQSVWCPVSLPTTGYTMVSGNCVLDSITHFNPLNHAATSIYHQAPMSKYGLSVGGGTDALRYQVGGNLMNAIGGVSLPSVFRGEAAALGFPASAGRPNAENQASLRVNMDAQVTPKLELTFSSSYDNTYQKTPAGGYLGAPEDDAANPLVNDSLGCWGYCTYPYGPYASGQGSPLFQLGQSASQNTQALMGGLTARWVPNSWLIASATVGLQHESQEEQAVLLPQAELVYIGDTNQGAYGTSTSESDQYTATLSATATNSLTHRLLARTTISMSLADNRQQGQSASVIGGITPTNLSLNGYANPSVTQTAARVATLGGGVEERFEYADRLFLGLGIRGDAGSGFGNSYSFQPYYHADLSWLAINTPSVVIRPHATIGGAGIQPDNGMAAQIEQAGTAWYSGNQLSVTTLTQVGNPALQPERSVEYEGGLDIQLWQNRLSLEVTGYSKTTLNDIVSMDLGFEYSYASVYENLGEVRNSGLEAALTAIPVMTREVTWTISANTSMNSQKIVSFAPGYTGIENCQSGQCNVVGYPIDAYWAQRINYSDNNGDGIIEPSEVSQPPYAASLSYFKYEGSAFPIAGAVQTTLAGWRNLITVNVDLDYATDFKVNNNQENFYDRAGVSEADYVPGMASPGRQATINLVQFQTPFYYQNGSYLALRELGVTGALPRRWAQRLRLNGLSLTGAVRNLALWTGFPGDPEVSDLTAQPGVLRNYGFGSVPLARVWFLRLNVGL